MKKTVVVLIALIICIPVITFAADITLTSDGKVPGTPFQYLQSEIDQLKIQLQNIQLTPGPQGPTGPQGPAGVANGISAAVYGSLNADGTIIQGTGFTVSHTAYSGHYDIYFNTPFTAPPNCIATNNDYLAYSVTVATGKCVAAANPQPNGFTIECGWLGLACVGANCDYNVIRTDLVHPLPGDLSFNFICVK